VSYIVAADFLGRRIDLLGQATGITWNQLQAGLFFPIFTTNNSHWPTGAGATFIAYVTIDRQDGGAQFPVTTAVSIGTSGSLVWCAAAVNISTSGTPVTLYAGQGLAVAALPGAYSDGVVFGVNLATYSSVAGATNVVLAAYGWAE
jgi:hypothetical protein